MPPFQISPMDRLVMRLSFPATNIGVVDMSWYKKHRRLLYQVITHLCSDGAHRRESFGIRPVFANVARVMGADEYTNLMNQTVSLHSSPTRTEHYYFGGK